MIRASSLASAALIVAASLLLTAITATAHDTRNVGPYRFQVGWLDEPAYVGQLNSLELVIVETATSKPVFGAEKTLSVEIQAGGLAPSKLDLGPADDPNDGYVASVVPTVTGSYTFHIFGKLGTTNIDEKFRSGPNTFDDVEDIAGLQYPAKVPVGGELGKKLDAIQSGIDQTRLIAFAALAVSVIAFGATALPKRRRA